MGMNYYLRRVISDDAKADMHKKLDEVLNDFCSVYELKDDLDFLIDKNKLHLGKRSYGWQFHWQANKAEYDDNLFSIISFLKKEVESGSKIIDESNEEYTVDEFINNEVGDSLFGYANKDDNKVFYNARLWSFDHPNDKQNKEALSLEYITSEGLRFSEGYFR